MIAGAIDAFRERHQRSASLIGNASSLAAGNLANAVLGFLYWALAARSFPPEAVGYAAAAISLMGFASLLGEFGLGTLLLGEIQRDLKRAPSLISAVLSASIVLSALCGLAAVVMCHLMSIELGAILSTWAGLCLFVVACAASGFALVLDGVLIGFLMSERQLIRNVALSIIKLALLAAVAFAGQSNHAEFSIFSTWAAATLFSIVLVAALSIRFSEPVWAAPTFESLKPQLARALQHHALNIATLAPAVILPFIVTATLSAEINAAFFAGWMLLGVVLMIPAALTTVLFTVGAKDPKIIAHHITITLAISVLTGLAAGAGFYCFGDFVLRLFNPVYPAIMGPSLQYLGISVVFVMVKYHYIAIQRLHDRMLRASIMLGAGAVTEITFAIVGAHAAGLWGLTIGWMAAVLLQALVMLPTVLAASSLAFRSRPRLGRSR